MSKATSTAVLCSVEEFLSSPLDFIIVGGGTAGLALAARLSEDDRYRVGVLEAGANKLEDPLVNVPTLYMQAVATPEYDWTLKSVPQVYFSPFRSSASPTDRTL
jgi:choline dehydrogenase-like flavoprotein